MNGRAFLNTARRLVGGKAEEDWRTAASRAYYALLLEGRETLVRWGFVVPSRDSLHTFVRLHFLYAAEPDLKRLGRTLEQLSLLRNRADYELSAQRWFGTTAATKTAIIDAANALQLLDQIDADPSRRAAAVASVKAAFP